MVRLNRVFSLIILQYYLPSQCMTTNIFKNSNQAYTVLLS